MHSVAQRQDGPMMDYTHPRRNNTTALDTQGLDTNHTSHIRVNSLSSKGSSSDYTLLRTPQDSTQSDNDALIKQDADSPNGGGWKPTIGLVQEQFTSSPIEEGFPSIQGRGVVGKPMPGAMHINTSIPQRTRPAAYSAHPNQKPIASQLPAPQSATAAFPPMLFPSPPLPRQTIGTTASNNRPAEVKLPEAPRPNPSQSQHRRTKSAPLLSLSPVLTSPPEAANPLTPPAVNTNHANNVNVNTIRPHKNSLNLHNATAAAYPQINPMTQTNALSFTANPADARPFMGAPTTAGFSTFPAMNGFAGMPVAPQTVSPLMWPPAFFPPQTAPGSFYPARPQVASPTNNMYSPAPTTTWKINPNSQPQMPLSHLINQANGLLIGGPSAHNRKIGLYKTEICRNWEEKQSCRYGPKCQFAHGPDDIRIVPRHPKYKTEICRTFWVTGSCPYGKRCCFIHPTATSQQPAPAPVNTEQTERDTQHTISLLARLDIKRNSPDGNARQTPDTEASVSDRSGFVYPGTNGYTNVNGIEAAERSASTARV